MVRVARVEPGGLAAEVGIVAGTELKSVNGRAIADFLDWEFLTADEELVIEATLPGGEELLLEIERDGGEPFGLALEPPNIRRCANRCEFCFIEGLPTGLRRSLYVRDDDYRLSFAYGNFATLSNLRERDVARILEYRLSPLYVSVHATNWEVRKVLLNNPRVPDVVAQLRALAAGGIRFHCQMVVVPGMNDGPVLEESLSDLWALGDAVMTAAVVPVGLTQFSHLYTGRSMDATNAGELLDQVDRWAARALRERGEPWVYGSDELYLLAGRELPPSGHYCDFAQIENGVGAITALRDRVARGIGRVRPLDGARIGVVTGVAMARLLPDTLAQLEGATGAKFELIPVVNSLFGPTITTAGLLVGADIRRALAQRTDLAAALIPAETLNDDRVFLDDESFDAVADSLPIPVHPSYDFVDVLEDGAVLTRAARGAAAA